MANQNDVEFFQKRVEALTEQRKQAEAEEDYDLADSISEKIEAYTFMIDQFLDEQGLVENE